MSASFRTRAGAIAIGVSFLALAAAVAQQATQRDPRNPSPPTQSQPDASNPLGQRDVVAPPIDRTVPGRQPYSANYRGSQANDAHNAVQLYFANCLLKHNQAEIELGQFAAEQSQNPRVKEFAQMLVKDHQKVVDKLQQVAGAGGLKSNRSTTLDDANPTTPGRRINETPGLPGIPGADTATPGVGTTAETRTPQAGQNPNVALMQVADIEQKIADRCQQALKEELQSKNGAEFDECFIGAQIGGHMHMLAALEVLSQESQGQVKQIADEARTGVKQHLDEAKQIAKQLKSGDQGSATATRPRPTERQ